MAERKSTEERQQEKRVAEVREELIQDDARAVAAAQLEAERTALDETVPGGRYEVDGRLVNADGEPVKQ